MLRTIQRCSENCNGGKSKYIIQFYEDEPPEEFEIDEKYVLSKVLYYTVCAATDMTTGETVAIKKIGNVISTTTYGQRAFRELQILRELRNPFIVKVKDVMLPSDKYTFNDIYVVSEIMQQTLNEYLEKIVDDEMGRKKVSNFNIKLIMSQLLRGLQYMHSSGVVHRDIKADNVLMDGMRVRLCDFGQSRQKADQMTRYVGTICYNPPEYFLNQGKYYYEYGESADIWALGCVLSEILHPDKEFILDIQRTSNEDLNCLHKIAEYIRVPEHIEELHCFIDDKDMLLFAREKLPHTPKEPLREKFSDVEDKRVLDLLEKMLEFNPHKRITIEEALKHEYMADITVEVLAKELNLDSSEVEQLENWSPCKYVVENCGSANKDELRDKLYDLCLSFKTGDK